MYFVMGRSYAHVLVVNADGKLRRDGDSSITIPSCLKTKDLRRKLLYLLPKGEGNCLFGCHNITLRCLMKQNETRAL